MRNSIASLVITSILILSTVNAKIQNYWHDSDRYIVEMDGEGDATVLAYISLQNIGTESIKSVTLEIPNERSMIHYITEDGYNVYGYGEMAGGINVIDSYSIQRLSDSVLVKIDLTSPLEQNGRRSLILVYTTPEVAKKDIIERFHINFKTIKDSSSFVRDVYVSLSPPPDYYLKGFEGKVDYKPSFVLKSLQAGNMESARMGIDYIKNAEGKHFTNLDPGESAVVTGVYSEYWWTLYYFEIIGTLAIGFVLFFIIHLYARGVRR
jgi:hypothetical protein